jgi:hypothetical protein
MLNLGAIFRRRDLNKELQIAIFFKEADEVKRLLRRGANPSGWGSRQTHLGRAIEGQNAEIIGILIDAGADARQPFRYMGFEISMVEAAEKLGVAKDIVAKLKHAERDAIERLGSGPQLRRQAQNGCCSFRPL